MCFPGISVRKTSRSRPYNCDQFQHIAICRGESTRVSLLYCMCRVLV